MLTKIKDDVYIRIRQGTYYIMAAKPRYIYLVFSHFIRCCISHNLNKISICASTLPCFRSIIPYIENPAGPGTAGFLSNQSHQKSIHLEERLIYLPGQIFENKYGCLI